MSDDAKDSAAAPRSRRGSPATPASTPHSVKYVTKEQALAEAKEQFSSQTLKFLAGNPFPARFEVKAKNPDQSAVDRLVRSPA